VPDVTPPEHLATGNGRLLGIDGAGENFVGPGIGGFLFGAARRVPFFLDAVSFFAAALLVRTSVPSNRSKLRHAGGASASGTAQAQGTDREPFVDGEYRHGRGWTSDFGSGLRVFRRSVVLKLLAATMASANFTQSIVFGLVVVYAERTLRLDSTGYGLFLAGASVLAVIGSFFAGRLVRLVGGAGVVVIGIFLATVSYVGLSFTRVAIVAVFVFGLQEIGIAIANVGSVTTRQRLIPRHLFGRVTSVHRLMGGIAAPLGAMAGGLIATVSSVPMAMFVAGGLEAIMLAYLAPALLQSAARAGV